MAIELCSEKSAAGSGVSPRISFSYDFCQADVVTAEHVQHHPLRSHSLGLNSNIDFDFCVGESFDHESSSADELFSNGKILPTQIKKKTAPSGLLDQVLMPQPQPPPPPPALPDDNKILRKETSTKESKFVSNEADDKQSSKSFWRFKRSSSCGNGYGRSLCPLPLLSRSNSTGSADSAPSVKRSPPLSKDGSSSSRHNSHKSSPIKLSQSAASMSHQKPPLLKKGHGSYANGVSINPVLNVPSANLFGLGSIFSNGKDKSKKKS